jgi:hypothetical protein
MATQIDEYGQGLTFPMQRDGRGDFQNAKGVELVRNDLAHLFGIVGPTADSPGELPWNTQVGSRLVSLKHRRGYDEVVDAQAQMMTSDVARRWERRVRVWRTRVLTVEGNNGVERRVETSFSLVGRRGGTVEKTVLPLKG